MMMSSIVKVLKGVVVMVTNLRRMRLLHKFGWLGNSKGVSGQDREEQEE